MSLNCELGSLEDLCKFLFLSWKNIFVVVGCLVGGGCCIGFLVFLGLFGCIFSWVLGGFSLLVCFGFVLFCLFGVGFFGWFVVFFFSF